MSCYSFFLSITLVRCQVNNRFKGKRLRLCHIGLPQEEKTRPQLLIYDFLIWKIDIQIVKEIIGYMISYMKFWNACETISSQHRLTRKSFAVIYWYILNEKRWFQFGVDPIVERVCRLVLFRAALASSETYFGSYKLSYCTKSTYN